MLEAPFKWRVPLVVLGAGKGQRMGSASGGLPKVLLSIVPAADGRPECTALDLLVRAWKPWASELHLVASRETDRVRAALERLPLSSSLHIQPNPDGTVNALLRLAKSLPERFVVLLGDCLIRGRFNGPDVSFPGIGVWQQADPDSVRANYAVTLREQHVAAVEEKPARAEEKLCGMGVYFLDQGFLEKVADLPADRRGRRELTDALEHFIARGGRLHASILSGEYVNINTPADLQRARRLFGQP